MAGRAVFNLFCGTLEAALAQTNLAAELINGERIKQGL